MIRDILLYLTTPLTGPLGAAWIHAARSESARADAAELNEALAIGERDEARRVICHEREHADGWRLDSIRNEERAEKAEHEIETLRSELASARVADDEAGEVGDAAMLAMTTDLGRAEIRIGQLTRERDELQRRLDSRGEATPVEAKPEACTWCLGPVADDWYARGWRVYRHEGLTKGPAVDNVHPLCKPCYVDPAFDAADVRARVATRAASCPARRVADPLAIACPACPAQVGAPCMSELKALTREAEIAGTVDPHCSRCATFGHTFRECMRPAGY